MTTAAKQASNKAHDGKAAKERELLVELAGQFKGEARLDHYENACTVLGAKVDELTLTAAACRDKVGDLLAETVLDDSPEIWAAIDTNREAAEAAEREAEVAGRRLVFFQRRRDAAKTQATAAQIEEMRDRVDQAGEQAFAGGTKIDAWIDAGVETLYGLGDPLKVLFQVSPREIVNMDQAKTEWLFAEMRRRITAHERGTRPLPSVAAAMRDVGAVGARSFDEQHPQQQEA